MRSSVGIARFRAFLLRTALSACLVTAALWAASPAAAAPTTPEIQKKRQQATAAQARLDDLAAQLELRSEEYAEIVENLAQTRARVAETREGLEKAQDELDSVQSALSDRAARIYRTGDVGFVEVLFGVRDFGDLLSWFDFMRHVARSDATAVLSVKSAVAKVERTERVLESRMVDQSALREQARTKRIEVKKAVDAQRVYLKGLNAEVTKLVREEQERQARIAAERARRAAEVAAAAAAAAAARSQRATNVATNRRFDPDALGSGHPEVVGIGLQYVGVPYVWGGSTPESGFDCSGLTQYAYAKAGVDIPRNSRSQFVAGTFITPSRLDLLAAGDLVFFGYGGDPNQVHHVGIYVGGDSFLHAPQTGQPVQVSSLSARIAARADYVGGCRF